MDKFKVVVADPPWGGWNDKLKMSDVPRGADANYKTLSIDDIKKIPVQSICDSSGAVLALWVPSSILQDGLDVMKSWGFNHKQTYIWVKNKKISLNLSLIKALKKQFKTKTIDKADLFEFLSNNEVELDAVLSMYLGRLFRQTHEICLIGTNNNKIYKSLKNKSMRSVSFGQNLKHSAKPDHLQDSLDLMFPGCAKIELFSRREKSGWHTVGNENPSTYGEDIFVSLEKIRLLQEK